MAELDETFVKMAQNSKKSEYLRMGQEIRRSEFLNNRKVVSKKKGNKSGVLLGYGILIVAGVLAVGYFTTKSDMKGVQIEPRTGFTTVSEESTNPTFQEVVDEMINKGK